jgi:DNA mismatch repair protein MSH5
MAHIGSFVPAKESLIPLTDKILTRVTTRESVTESASSFMLDLVTIIIDFLVSNTKSIKEFNK